MNGFLTETKNWFSSSVGTPTAVQTLGWRAIRSGTDALMCAPTGSGKTLAAFLYFLDAFKRESMERKIPDEVRVIYISPLKALGNDIQKNLMRPLSGLSLENSVRVSVRNGDTSQSERRQMLVHPPHILITTPESLYLMLSSKSGRRILSTAKCAIIDEFHATVSSKRGTHLSLSLARLDNLCARRLQRIALSATIRPLDEAKRQLSGSAECEIISPESEKKTELIVDSSEKDMRILPENSIWPSIAERMIRHMQKSKTTLVFTEGRASCERLAQNINEKLKGEYALTHHGCVSKEKRLAAENSLKNGELKAMIATSSMELGIDVGDIDQVVQVGNPMSVSALMQRMGRAGHSPGRVSRMCIYPKTAYDAVSCALTAKAASLGQIERVHACEMSLDILSQHLVSMASAGGEYTVAEAVRILSGAYPYRNLTEDIVKSVLVMLAGDYEHGEDKPVRPRILYDRLSGTVTGDRYTDMLALSSGGTIPDRGWYAVTLADGTRLGELDEEYVFEARIGDKFLLGAFPWKIINITRDRVIVEKTTRSGAQSPFWKGDGAMRAYETGIAFGKHMKRLSESAQNGKHALIKALMDMHLTENAAMNASRLLLEQLSYTDALPTEQTVIFEHFKDEAGEHQLMIHSVFGGRVNRALGMLLAKEAQRLTGTDVRAYDDDDGILLCLIGGKAVPDGLIYSLNPETVRNDICTLLPVSPMFTMQFRYNAQRAMMMGARSGKRSPLWIQRLRGAETLSIAAKYNQHPIILETMRECAEHILDLDALKDVLIGVQTGRISVLEIHNETPSPMCLNLRRQVEADLMYESVIPSAAGMISKANEGSLTPLPAAVSKAADVLKHPRNEEEAHTLLMQRGDILPHETEIPVDWLIELSKKGRARYIEPGLWIAREHEKEYEDALLRASDIALSRIIRRLTRYTNGQSIGSFMSRYGVDEERTQRIIADLSQAGDIIPFEDIYVHKDVYENARQHTVAIRRREVQTLSSERYADALTSRVRTGTSAIEQLTCALHSLILTPFPYDAWEEYILPARVTGYRPQMLDDQLSTGRFFYAVHPGEKPFISFHLPEEEDIQQDPEIPEALTDCEKQVFMFLKARGASFARAISAGAGIPDVRKALKSLFEKGYIRQDRFAPVRQWFKEEKGASKTIVRSRIHTMDAGRWEICRPLKEKTHVEILDGIFDTYLIASKETARNHNWPALLEVLRQMEYAGKVRRGYFVKGLSGMQFVRECDYEKVKLILASPSEMFVCLTASDPLQPWGALLKHESDFSFTRLSSCAVVLHSGKPVLTFEKSGQTLSVYDENYLKEALACFVHSFNANAVFTGKRKITVKCWPECARQELLSAGFMHEALDFVLYRS